MSLKLMAASFDKMMMIANNIHMCVHVQERACNKKLFSEKVYILLSMYCC